MGRPLRAKGGEQRMHAVHRAVRPLGQEVGAVRGARGAEELLEEGWRRLRTDPERQLLQRVEQEHAARRDLAPSRQELLAGGGAWSEGRGRRALVGRLLGGERSVGQRRRLCPFHRSPAVPERALVHDQQPGGEGEAGEVGRQQSEAVREGRERVGRTRAGSGRKTGRVERRHRRECERQEGEEGEGAEEDELVRRLAHRRRAELALRDDAVEERVLELLAHR
mmetsp:Transcript_24198/g.71763  ORF Transcript_24198/g.71763 Transcript_24198/m.71763 type:complete len:223 (-) Transcript_24198:556-1224(-)